MSGRRYWMMERRMELGLNQRQLAEKCGCTDRAISNYETGKRDPSIRTARCIISIIGGNFEDFYK